MQEWQGKRYWLIGASEGLGREVARIMSRAGAELILSARSEDRLRDLSAELPGKSRVLPFDVTDRAAVSAAVAEAGDLDGIVYLAGLYWPQKVQGWDPKQAEAMAEVNFLGAIRVLGDALPAMVERDSGHIALISSLAGYRGLPGMAAYGATKAGVIGLAEGLYADLRTTGVQVQVLNPGFIRTRKTAKNDFAMPFLMDADKAAHEVFEHMNSETFKKSFPLPMSLAVRMSQFLPDWLYYRLIARG